MPETRTEVNGKIGPPDERTKRRKDERSSPCRLRRKGRDWPLWKRSMLKRGRNRRAARLRRRAPRASTKARTTGGRLRRMGPRGPLRGRSPLRGLRPPQAARPRPADPPASGARTPLRGSRKTTNLMPRAENNVSSSVHAQQSGFCGPRKHDNPRNACLRLPTQRKPSALRHRGRLLAFLWDGSGSIP